MVVLAVRKSGATAVAEESSSDDNIRLRFHSGTIRRRVRAMPWERGHSADIGKPVTPRISPPTRRHAAPNMSEP
jgi:hypothetical protein